MRKLIAVSSVLMVAFTSVLSQEATQRYGLTCYTNFEVPRSSKWGYFSPAFAWIRPSGNYLECELSKLSFGKEEQVNNDFSVSTGDIAARGEYSLALGQIGSAVIPYVGLGCVLHFSHRSIVPINAVAFPTRTNTFAIPTGIDLRVAVRLSDHFFIHVSAVTNVAQVQWVQYYIENPTLPEHARVNSEFEFASLKGAVFRLGLGLRV